MDKDQRMSMSQDAYRIRHALHELWRDDDPPEQGNELPGLDECSFCGADIVQQDTDIWEKSDQPYASDGARYCPDAENPEHLHLPESEADGTPLGGMVSDPADRYPGPGRTELDRRYLANLKATREQS
jgi:hypothetical protein